MAYAIETIRVSKADVPGAGRDLLALRYTRNNLKLNGCAGGLVSTSQRTGIPTDGGPPIDLAVGVLRESEGTEGHVLTVEQASRQLAAGGHIVVAASSTAISRMTSPAGVIRVKCLPLRENTSTPSSSSRSLICLLMPGCDVYKLWAVADTLSSW